ncbi:MAG: hypothetical protein ACLQNE_37160 [Thermoguttaceae bacterium]
MAKTSTKTLDVYRDWLHIQETARPLDYYQLLKVPRFEDDAGKIRSSYRQLNAHVRKYATGEFGPESQRLLNELAKAMLCLTDAQRKREYDVSQGRKDEGTGRKRTLEEILLANKAVTSEQLAKARAFAKAIGLEVRDAIVQQRLAAQETVMQAYAESMGRSYLDSEDVAADAALARQVPPAIVRTHSCIPVMIDDGRVLVASPQMPDPGLEDQFRLRFGMPVWWVVCTPRSANDWIAKIFSREASAVAAEAAAKAAGKKAPGKIQAGKKTKEDDADEDPKSRTKKRLMIAWIAIVIILILYFVYRMIFS